MRVLLIAPIALFFLSSTPAIADELVLKDGRTIAWKIISDEGDFYEVTTPEGQKIKVDKDDIDRVKVGKKEPESPLTGASITFDRKRKLFAVDLISRIDPKVDSLGGDWRVNGRTLQGEGVLSAIAKCQISDFTPPQEYDLTMVVERRSGANSFMVGLVAEGNRQFAYAFDYRNGTWCGILDLDGKDPRTNESGIAGRFFEGTKTKTIKFMVRLDAFVIQVDGKDFYAWKADWKRVSLSPGLRVRSDSSFFVAIMDRGGVAIRQMVLTAPKDDIREEGR